MGLYINMEMPTSCDKCELMTANYGCAFVGAVGGESYRKRAWDCPLVEVPEQMKWIPVTERLPEEQGWCVACVFYRGIQWGDIETKGFTSVCPAYYFEGTFHKVSSEAEVTHWMPLPQPPETKN